MKLSSDGNLLLYGDLEGNNFYFWPYEKIGYVHLYDLRKGHNVSSFSIGNEKVTSLHFLSNKQIVASGETFISLNDMSGNLGFLFFRWYFHYFRKLWEFKIVFVYLLLIGNLIKQIHVDSKLGLITDMEREGTHLITSNSYYF